MYSGDDVTYIWMLGDNSVAIVNPNTMVYDLIYGFFEDPQEEVTPFTAICSTKSKKMIGLYMKENDIILVYMTPDGKFIRKYQSDIVDEGNLKKLFFK